MKTGSIFWGTLFIVLGGLFLLNNLDVLDVDWWTVMKLWPLVLVFWGLTAVFGKQPIRWYTVLFIIFLVIVMLAVTGVIGWFERHEEFDVADSRNQQFSEGFDGPVDRAEFRLSAGAGKFYLEGTTEQLIEASTRTTFGRYELDRDHSGGQERFSLRMRGGRSGIWFPGRTRNQVEVRLHPDPVWDIVAEVGAAALEFDLAPFKTSEVRIDGGAASFKLKLGDRSEETHVWVRTGASSVGIEVPESVGCELNIVAPLSGKHFPGFEKVGNRIYQTDDFDSSVKKIFIDVDAGVSSIRVTRY
ncbi:MAG: DUF5668 domain-containing protein [Bacteroidota bacterium]